MKLITVPQNAFHVGYGYLQNAGAAALFGSLSMRYHMYLITEGHPIKDTVTFQNVFRFKKEGETCSSPNKDGSCGGVSGKGSEKVQVVHSGKVRRCSRKEDIT